MDMGAFNAEVIRRFRAGEEIEGLHRDRLVLLTTTGRRSGEPRTAPMMFVDFDGDPLVVGSNDGAAVDPDWVQNLRADPHAHVETPDGRRDRAVAEELTGAERQQTWAELVAGFPFFADQQERAGDRVIPLIRLRRCD
ncbi:nitroreductase family deazaflavin-dependent oxidoreductase [Amnibacterium setariae]|uniref:Nitroreductase family deazaflavin-dependent oxidoreductase n=1 Tax=Amnibacterium setariae TaxID=2306585 RepID=A0A3A1TXQ5_9MICO|nr:nitroreductase family deazaflavin-dependent oxidoreductase [Amnibacterium setariae]RIX28351.1 nitroreductase family deazaflavin-dependent oxidoreductase [Amnibacterium setariae]